MIGPHPGDGIQTPQDGVDTDFLGIGFIPDNVRPPLLDDVGRTNQENTPVVNEMPFEDWVKQTESGARAVGREDQVRHNIEYEAINDNGAARS